MSILVNLVFSIYIPFFHWIGAGKGAEMVGVGHLSNKAGNHERWYHEAVWGGTCKLRRANHVKLKPSMPASLVVGMLESGVGELTSREIGRAHL